MDSVSPVVDNRSGWVHNTQSALWHKLDRPESYRLRDFTSQFSWQDPIRWCMHWASRWLTSGRLQAGVQSTGTVWHRGPKLRFIWRQEENPPSVLQLSSNLNHTSDTTVCQVILRRRAKAQQMCVVLSWVRASAVNSLSYMLFLIVQTPWAAVQKRLDASIGDHHSSIELIDCHNSIVGIVSNAKKITSSIVGRTMCWGTKTTLPLTFTMPCSTSSSDFRLEAMPACAITCPWFISAITRPLLQVCQEWMYRTLSDWRLLAMECLHCSRSKSGSYARLRKAT